MMIAAHNSAEFLKRSQKPPHRTDDQPASAWLHNNTTLEEDRGEEDHSAQEVRPNPQALSGDGGDEQPAEEQPAEEQPAEDPEGLPNLQATATNPKAEELPGEELPGEEQPGEEQPGQEH